MTEPAPESPVELGILPLTKQALNIPADSTDFDVELTMFINSVLSNFTQLGIGPEIGMEIVDSNTKWSEFLEGEKRYNDAQTLLYLRVRLLFDPPDSYFVVAAFKEEIEKAEWRLNVAREEIVYPPPVLVPVDPDDL